MISSLIHPLCVVCAVIQTLFGIIFADDTIALRWVKSALDSQSYVLHICMFLALTSAVCFLGAIPRLVFLDQLYFSTSFVYV